ncbi:MAG: HD domain-containing protein [Elusimicrobia bacterium]|nr:HD domain-containing protein [Candidatus Obscuribacterium magneticum]
MSMSAEEQERKKKLHEALRQMFFAWNATYKFYLLYAPDHPTVQQSLQNLVNLLQGVFRSQIEVNVQHMSGIFLVEEMLFIEESLVMYDLLRTLEELKISNVVFLPGLEARELAPFFLHLLQKPELAGKTIHLSTEGYTSDHLRVMVESGSKLDRLKWPSYKERFKQLAGDYTGWVERTQKIFTKLLDEQSFLMSDLSGPLEELYDNMVQDPEGYGMNILWQPVKNLPIQHSLNTMILSLYLGHQLGFSTGLLKQLAIAALLHDVGRFFLSPDLTTGTPITNHDAEIIRLHSQDGAAFLMDVPGLPMSTVRVALEHHMGFDRQGYPALPPDYKTHFFSQIVGLADFMSWRTVSENFYHRPVPIYRLLRAVLRRAGSQFDPFLVKLLVPLFGFYPPGTYVKLENRMTALSVRPNIRNISRPTIAYQSAAGWESPSLTRLSAKPPANYGLSIERVAGEESDGKKVIDLVSSALDITTIKKPEIGQ